MREKERQPSAMNSDEPSLITLERLATSADIRDRAFAASALCLRRHAVADRAEIVAVYERIRETAALEHAEVRARIRSGTLDTRAFLAQLREAPPNIRDHLVEEVLGIAYPPLEDHSLPHDASWYSPSGLSEILFTLERADLGPGKTFVDLGSGLGKVVLLVALLSGASAHGVELDPELAVQAQAAARSLNLDNAHFIAGDIRESPLPTADVYYMFIPLSRSADVASRIREFAGERRILLFSQTLDLKRLPWLRSAKAASYWLEMYEKA